VNEVSAENLAKTALGLQPAILGISLIELDLVLRIILTCVGIASGISAFVYYRVKSKQP